MPRQLGFLRLSFGSLGMKSWDLTFDFVFADIDKG
jgi:hypothetical protein